mmetsp:Transcript_61859/g.148849  ORF Transcript_61859/g.148849 Transcript_61859/m.148849 type:complete len:224 (-) Transcript_61859:661-1332(-)
MATMSLWCSAGVAPSTSSYVSLRISRSSTTLTLSLNLLRESADHSNSAATSGLRYTRRVSWGSDTLTTLAKPRAEVTISRLLCSSRSITLSSSWGARSCTLAEYSYTSRDRARTDADIMWGVVPARPARTMLKRSWRRPLLEASMRCAMHTSMAKDTSRLLRDACLVPSITSPRIDPSSRMYVPSMGSSSTSLWRHRRRHLLALGWHSASAWTSESQSSPRRA